MPLIHTVFKKLSALAEREPFFVITLLLTAVLALFSRPHFSAVRWNVITTMFSLMLVCLAFERCRLLTSLAGLAVGAFRTPQRLGFAMIFVTGALSMFITNDVALLTVVPLTLTMAELAGQDPYILVILETMSANIFSALTPFGNPQNLYLYTFFRIPPWKFFAMMAPLCLFGAGLICLANLLFSRGGAYPPAPRRFELRDRRLLAGAAGAFVLNLLSVLRVLDYRIAFAATLLVFLCFAPRLLAHVDYFLLATFVLFFLFTSSVTGIGLFRDAFAHVLHSRATVLLVSAGLSQVISNVPAAVVLSGFTPYCRELLYGVTAGGLGTLVASLASLISYKLYIRRYQNGKYIKSFSLLNFGVLVLMLAAVLLYNTLI